MTPKKRPAFVSRSVVICAHLVGFARVRQALDQQSE